MDFFSFFSVNCYCTFFYDVYNKDCRNYETQENLSMDAKAQIIQRLIKEKDQSLSEYARQINMPYSTLAGILKSGLEIGSVSNVTKICGGVGLTYDMLREMAGELEFSRPQGLPKDLEEKLQSAHYDRDMREIIELLPTTSRNDFKLIYDLVIRLTKK